MVKKYVYFFGLCNMAQLLTASKGLLMADKYAADLTCYKERPVSCNNFPYYLSSKEHWYEQRIFEGCSL